MTIDLSINLGHIISLIGFLIAMVTWGNSLKFGINEVKHKVNNQDMKLMAIEKQLEEQTKLIIATSIMSDRLGSLEKRLDMLNNRLESPRLSERT